MVRNADPTSALATPLVYLPGSKTPAPPILTAEEVCKLVRFELERGESALRRLEHYRLKGLLPAVKLGHDIRFKLVDCLAFIDRQQESVPR